MIEKRGKIRAARPLSIRTADPVERGGGDWEEWCRNESRSRIVVVVHPIMRLARHFRSRAANNPFSTWEALIIVWMQKRWKERKEEDEEKEERRKRDAERKSINERMRGVRRGQRGGGNDRWCCFIFFRSWLRLLEIIYRPEPSPEAGLIRSIRGNNRGMSSGSLSSRDIAGRFFLMGPVHPVCKSPRPQIESRNRFQAAIRKPSRAHALKYIHAV